MTEATHKHIYHYFSTMTFHDLSMTDKMNFHDLYAQHIFLQINDTPFMNAYENKNICPSLL